MRKLHPNAIVIFYIQGFFASCFILGFLLIFPIIFLVGLAATEGALGFIPLAGSLIILGAAAIFLLPFLWAYFAYKNYGYQLDETRIAIEKGVVWKRHVSIPYERVQNVDIIRGPLARLLGVSDLQIQTAGAHFGGYYGATISEGRIPAISPDEAIKLKDEILSKISRSKDQGL